MRIVHLKIKVEKSHHHSKPLQQYFAFQKTYIQSKPLHKNINNNKYQKNIIYREFSLHQFENTLAIYLKKIFLLYLKYIA